LDKRDNEQDISEASRTRLIGEIASVLRRPEIPPETRQAGLTLIGWLARRLPQDGVMDSRRR
jgi:hypothetical protein